MTATITFRTKIKTVYNPDHSVAFKMVQVPKLTRSHCDMRAMRDHPKFGSYANSDLFPNMLNRIRQEIIGSAYRDYIKLDALPANVKLDTSGFLAVVTVEV